MMTDLKNIPAVDDAEEHAHCPRCGYDLRGIMETWEESCEISGTCSECGLEFEWGELLSPKRNVPKWCVEYSTGRGRGFLLAMVRTLLMMLRPWRFWSELRMHHMPQWGRLALMHLVMLLGMYFPYVISLGIYVNKMWERQVGVSGAMPDSRFVAVGKAVLLPLSMQGLGDGPASMRWTYPSPFTFTEELIGYWWTSIAAGSVFLALYILLCPICFLVLPQSRKQAKVKWAHIGRIFTHSLLMVWAFIYYTLIAASFMRSASTRTSYADEMMIGLFFGLIIGGFVWWSLATSRYLKMRHPWGVGLAMAVMSILGMMIIPVYVAWLL